MADFEVAGSKTYALGDKMKSMIGELSSQYKDSMPFPKPDSFGICNNHNSAHFMMDDESTCLQMANLET